MELTEAKKTSDSVDGWLTEKEGELLYNLARNCTGRGVIVEVGSWKGKSTIMLGAGSKNGKGVRVYAIDPHTGASEHKQMYGKVWTYEEFAKNISGAELGDIITPLVKTSKDAAMSFNEPVEFAFIDGAHEYEFVKEDFENWFPKIIIGGIMAFHDTAEWHGPKKVVEEFLYKSKHFRNVKFVDTITYGEKVNLNSAAERLKNKFTLSLRNVSEFARKMKLPAPVKTLGKKLLGRV